MKQVKKVKEKKMKFEIGQQLVIDGFRWVIVEEIDEDGCVWAIDKDGQDHLINAMRVTAVL